MCLLSFPEKEEKCVFWKLISRWPESLAQKCGCHTMLQNNFAHFFLVVVVVVVVKKSISVFCVCQVFLHCVVAGPCSLSLVMVILLLKSPVMIYKTDWGCAASYHGISTVICEIFIKIRIGLLVECSTCVVVSTAKDHKEDKFMEYF